MYPIILHVANTFSTANALGDGGTISVGSHLTPYNFHIFGPLNKALKGHRFQLGNEVQHAVRDWFHLADYRIL
jgi:hypothetical protein